MCVPTCLTAFLDGKGYGKLATGDKGGAVTLWDADALVAGAKGLARGKRPAGGTEGARVFRLPKAHTDWVTQLTFTTSLFSGALLSSAMDGVIQCIDLGAEAVGRSLRGHTKGVYSIAMCEAFGGSKLVSGGLERDLYVWSLNSPKPLAVLPGHRAPIRQLATDEEFQQVVSLDSLGAMRVWDLRMMRCVQSLNAPLAEGEDEPPPPILGNGLSDVGAPSHTSLRSAVSAIWYDRRRRRLIGGHQHLTAWHSHVPPSDLSPPSSPRESRSQPSSLGPPVQVRLSQANQAAIEGAEAALRAAKAAAARPPSTANFPTASAGREAAAAAATTAPPTKAPPTTAMPSSTDDEDGDGDEDGVAELQPDAAPAAAPSLPSPRSLVQISLATAGTTLTRLVYAHAYGLVAVGDVAGVLSVWAVATGQLVRCVRDAHGGAPITSLTTDAHGRKLISGAHDGSVCTWSLATGCELSCRLAPHDVDGDLGNELTTLIHLSVARGTISYVLGSGWGRRIVLWRAEEAPQGVCAEPGGGSECVWASPPSHSDDVLCMAHHAPATLATAPSTLATGSADGMVAVWELDTNALSQHGGMGRPVESLDQGGIHTSLNAMRVKRMLRVPPAPSLPGSSSAAAGCSSPSLGFDADLIDASAVECVCLLPSIAPPLVPLVAATADGRLVVWGAATRLPPGQPPMIDLHDSLGHCDEDSLVALATDALNTTLVSADGGGTIKVTKPDEARRPPRALLSVLRPAGRRESSKPSQGRRLACRGQRLHAPDGFPRGSARLLARARWRTGRDGARALQIAIWISPHPHWRGRRHHLPVHAQRRARGHIWRQRDRMAGRRPEHICMPLRPIASTVLAAAPEAP